MYAVKKAFHNTILKNIVKGSAEKNSLAYVISDELANIAIKHIDQTESDCNFLTRLATEHNAITAIKKGKIVIFSSRSGGGYQRPPPARADYYLNDWW